MNTKEKIELVNKLLDENEFGLMVLTDYCEAYIDRMVTKKGHTYFTGCLDGQTFDVEVGDIIKVFSVKDDDEEEFVRDTLLATLK